MIADEKQHLLSDRRRSLRDRDLNIAYRRVLQKANKRPGDPDARCELGRLATQHRSMLAHGALVCPGCGLPIAAHGQLRFAGEVRCGFCDHTAAARDFVVEDVYDTVANEVYVVARVV